MTDDNQREFIPPTERATWHVDPNTLDSRLERGDVEIDLEVESDDVPFNHGELDQTRDVVYVVIEDMAEQRDTLSRTLLKGYGNLETQSLAQGVELGRRDVLAFPSAVAALDALAFGKEVKLTQYTKVDGRLRKKETVVDGAKYANHLIFAFVDYRMDQGDPGIMSEDQVALFKEVRKIRGDLKSPSVDARDGRQARIDELAREFEAAGKNYTRPGTSFVYAMGGDPRLVGVEFVSANIDLVIQDPISTRLEQGTRRGDLPVVLYLPKSANTLVDARTAFYSSLGITKDLTDVVGAHRNEAAKRVAKDVVTSGFDPTKYVAQKGLASRR
jgi:hypothetical protein